MLLTMKEDKNSPFYTNLHAQHFSPGWARPEPSMWAEPKPKFKPAVWRFAQAKGEMCTSSCHRFRITSSAQTSSRFGGTMAGIRAILSD